jgi:outer membrane protein OmpA-like peptidoglycan-associated protein
VTSVSRAGFSSRVAGQIAGRGVGRCARPCAAVRARVVAGVLAILLGGCTLMPPPAPSPGPVETPAPAPTPDPAPPPQVLPEAAPGTVVGWVSGEDRRDRRRRSMVSFGVRPLPLADVDRYVDGLEAALRGRLRGSVITVTRIGVYVTVSVPGSFAFSTDGAELRLASTGSIDTIAAVAGEFDRTMLEVAGHTDDSGADGYNQSLAERRAGAVAQRLQSHGVNAQRLVTIGVGKGRPVASNATPDGRQRNRRIEITFAPLTVR